MTGSVATLKRAKGRAIDSAYIRLLLERACANSADIAERELARSHLPPLAVYDALELLARKADGEMRPLDFERLLEIPQYSASRLIKRLVRDGLAAQVPHRVDRRSTYVKITPAGLIMAARMAVPYAIALERGIKARLSEQEAEVLCGLLARIGLAEQGDRPFTRVRRAPKLGKIR
ncbi:MULTISPECIES: MarR family winged helix-turn-helix transcriptional regulator [unclassified Bradyrhizobium]|uniref:MarR family winged helix-turn-helix transcriptional regulator n=1 Tax=unclassified Bradyrhizobium TaxID=2631580 RepID=UPI0023061839|nr:MULTISPECIES: MarR family transcriptional regulator [unclassified Bradyrhizobium]MDA9451199.1 hypothetical protein [Bradyrhizobium sp. CCBAU 21360]MDA9457578.1 hypothetical protein [Bradyrhizobium sp. CCBAU 21359]